MSQGVEGWRTRTTTAQMATNATWTLTSARRISAQTTRTVKGLIRCVMKPMTTVSTVEAVRVLDVAQDVTILPLTASQEISVTWTHTCVRIPTSVSQMQTATTMCQESVTWNMLNIQNASIVIRAPMAILASQDVSMMEEVTRSPAVRTPHLPTVTTTTNVRLKEDISC